MNVYMTDLYAFAISESADDSQRHIFEGSDDVIMQHYGTRSNLSDATSQYRNIGLPTSSRSVTSVYRGIRGVNNGSVSWFNMWIRIPNAV